MVRRTNRARRKAEERRQNEGTEAQAVSEYVCPPNASPIVRHYFEQLESSPLSRELIMTCHFAQIMWQHSVVYARIVRFQAIWRGSRVRLAGHLTSVRSKATPAATETHTESSDSVTDDIITARLAERSASVGPESSDSETEEIIDIFLSNLSGSACTPRARTKPSQSVSASTPCSVNLAADDDGTFDFIVADNDELPDVPTFPVPKESEQWPDGTSTTSDACEVASDPHQLTFAQRRLLWSPRRRDSSRDHTTAEQLCQPQRPRPLELTQLQNKTSWFDASSRTQWADCEDSDPDHTPPNLSDNDSENNASSSVPLPAQVQSEPTQGPEQPPIGLGSPAAEVGLSDSDAADDSSRKCSAQLCYFHLRGHCKRGSACRFSHSPNQSVFTGNAELILRAAATDAWTTTPTQSKRYRRKARGPAAAVSACFAAVSKCS